MPCEHANASLRLEIRTSLVVLPGPIVALCTPTALRAGVYCPDCGHTDHFTAHAGNLRAKTWPRWMINLMRTAAWASPEIKAACLQCGIRLSTAQPEATA